MIALVVRGLPQKEAHDEELAQPRWKNDFWQHTGHTESPASRGMCSKGSPTSTEAKTSAAIISDLRWDSLLGPSEWINVHNHEVQS